MGADGCCIDGCTARRIRHKGLSFFYLPNAKKHPEWRSKLLQIIRATRKTNVDVEKSTICSRHFNPQCILEKSSSRRKKKVLQVGSLPTLFLPERFKTTLNTARKQPAIRILTASTSRPTSNQPSFTDLTNDTKVPTGWVFENNQDNLILYKYEDGRCLRVVVDSSLECRMFYNDYMIPGTVILQSDLFSFLYNYENSDICLGIPDKNLQSYSDIDPTKYKNHFLHVKLKMDNPHVIEYQTTIRSTTCNGFSNLLNIQNICKNCYFLKANLERKVKRDMCTTETPNISP